MEKFNNLDLSSVCPPCTVDQLRPELVDALSEVKTLLKKAGVPFVVTCAYRSVEHDKAHGRSGRSSHCKGLAVDVRASNHYVRLQLVRTFLAVGFNRIGISKGFIHADLDLLKPASIWLYSPDYPHNTLTF